MLKVQAVIFLSRQRSHVRLSLSSKWGSPLSQQGSDDWDRGPQEAGVDIVVLCPEPLSRVNMPTLSSGNVGSQ